MNCDYCKEDATVFLSQVIDGQLQKVSLCDSCMKKQEIIESEGLEDLISSAEQLEIPTVTKTETQKMCPDCQFTLETLKNVGRLGCPTCYITFADEIYERLDSMHRGMTHTGKAPDPENTEKQLKKQANKLEEQLDTAISKEDFETAAAIRDQINRILD